MNLINWLNKRICASEHTEIEILKQTVEEQTKLREKLIEEIQTESSENVRRNRFENKFKKNKLIYRAQGEYERDVRTLICDKSHLLEAFINENKLNAGTDDEKILKIQKAVYKAIAYMTDNDSNKLNEYWEHPELTLQKVHGDCEDHMLLVKSLVLMCGIEDYKVKCVAGWVKDPSDKKKQIGHAYNIYLRDDNEWVVVDTTYYPDLTPIAKRTIHKEDLNYFPVKEAIWWTFTKDWTYSPEEVVVNE